MSFPVDLAIPGTGYRQLRSRLQALALGLMVLGSLAAGPTPGARKALPGQGALPPSLGEAGLPFLHAFSPKEYGAFPQNWAILQDLRGVIFVGNNDGVLAFDGVRWQLIPVSNGSCVRSLAMDTTGRIYVGAVGEFGVLEPDASGNMRYRSLVDRIPMEDRGFSDVSQTITTEEGVAFLTSGRIFRLGATVRVWKPRTAFRDFFQAGNRLFVREEGQGLLELINGEWRLLKGCERFAQEKIRVLLPWDGALLIGTQTQGFFRYDGTSVDSFPTEIDAALTRDLLYTAVRLEDGSLALGTLQNGLYFLDSQGRLRSHLAKAEGLPDPAVYALCQDRQGGIWMALNKGIVRAELGFPVSAWTDRNGLDGYVISMHRHGDTLYTSSAQSLFRWSERDGRFLTVPGLKGQNWAFLEAGPALLVANYLGVYEIRNGTPRMVRPSPTPSTTLMRSRLDPNRVFVGLFNGLASMRWEKDHWIDEGRIPGISDYVRNLYEMGDGRLWAGTFASGVLRLSLPLGWRGGATLPHPGVEHFGIAQGLPNLKLDSVFDLGGQPGFATQHGIFTFDEPSGRFGPDPHFAHLFPEGRRWVYSPKRDARGWIWMLSKDEARGLEEPGAAIPAVDGSYRWEPRPLRSLAGNWIETIFPDSDGVVWFGGPEGLYRYDSRIAKAYDQPFRCLARSFSEANHKLLSGGAGPAVAPTLKFVDNALRFEFAAPSFDGLEANRFQVLLEGVDKAWSSWSADAFRDYSNLREGRYRFRVRAKIFMEP